MLKRFNGVSREAYRDAFAIVKVCRHVHAEGMQITGLTAGR